MEYSWVDSSLHQVFTVACDSGDYIIAVTNRYYPEIEDANRERNPSVTFKPAICYNLLSTINNL